MIALYEFSDYQIEFKSTKKNTDFYGRISSIKGKQIYYYMHEAYLNCLLGASIQHHVFASLCVCCCFQMKP